MSRRPLVAITAFTVVLAGFQLGRTATANALLTDSAPVGANAITAAAVFVGPTVNTGAASKTRQYIPGYIRATGAYYVYANVTDGNGSGIASVTANVSSITTGQTAAALTAGSYTVGGVAYGWRSASLTANVALLEGTSTFSVTATDNQTRTATGNFTVIVDNTAPTAADIQTTNNGATEGKPETGDTITYTFSEIIDPDSLVAGWTGASATNVVVRILNIGSTDDTVQIWDSTNTTQLPLGTVDTNGDPVSANTVFGTAGGPSTMTQSGAVITVTLGAVSSGTPRTDGKKGSMVWTPSTAAIDRAGSACLAVPATESGPADNAF